MSIKSNFDNIITHLDFFEQGWIRKYSSLVVCRVGYYYIWMDDDYCYEGIETIYGHKLYFGREKIFLINCRYKNEIIPLDTKIILCTKYIDNLKLGENLKEFYYLGGSPFISNINLPIGLEVFAMSKNLNKYVKNKIKIPYGCKLIIF
jgi:hypothetical protein